MRRILNSLGLQAIMPPAVTSGVTEVAPLPGLSLSVHHRGSTEFNAPARPGGERPLRDGDFTRPRASNEPTRAQPPTAAPREWAAPPLPSYRGLPANRPVRDFSERLAVVARWSIARSRESDSSAVSPAVSSRRATRATRASDPSNLAKVMSNWHLYDNVESPATIARYRQIATEENALEFADFLRQLNNTADFKNPQLRNALEQKVGELMTRISSSKKFRQTCFAIALDLTATCRDGIALGLNNMTLALIDHDAEAGRYSQAELHEIGRNSFRLNVIDKITCDKIIELEKIYADDPVLDNKVDPVEVSLAYQTGLAQEFQLKGLVGEMLYRYDSKVTPNDLTLAANEIRRQEAASADVTFLAGWSPWQKAVQRHNPEGFKRYEVNRDDEREWLTCQPETMKDGAYLDALAEQKKHAEQGLLLFTKRHTWQFMDEHSKGRKG